MKNSFKVIRFALCVLLLCGFCFTTFAAQKLSSNYRNFAPGTTFPGHLQGIAADESGIYWSCYDRIIKTKWDGTLIGTVSTPTHAGDCCIKDGKLYVSTTFYKQEDILEAKGIRAAVYIYDCATLRFEKRILLPDIPMPDGITWYKGKFYLADNSVRKAHLLNAFYIYDSNFKFLRHEIIEIGVKTLFGAQTLNTWNDKLIAAFYPAEPYNGSCLIDPATFKATGLFPLKASVGLAVVPKSIAGKDDVFCMGRLCGKQGSYTLQASFHCIENGKLKPFPVKSLKTK